MNPSDCVSPAASATSAVYARPCCPHASRHVLDRHKFPGGRPPYKSNFYCHPGRAGGTPMLLGEVVNEPLVWFAERGLPQANRIALTKCCRCNNSSGDDFVHHVRLTGVLKLFKGSLVSFTHCPNRLRSESSRYV